MDSIVAVLMAIFGGLIVYVYKDKQHRDDKLEKQALKLELNRANKRRVFEKHRVRTEATKVAFNEAKKQFIDKYGKYIPNNDDSSSAK